MWEEVKSRLWGFSRERKWEMVGIFNLPDFSELYFLFRTTCMKAQVCSFLPQHWVFTSSEGVFFSLGRVYWQIDYWLKPSGRLLSHSPPHQVFLPFFFCLRMSKESDFFPRGGKRTANQQHCALCHFVFVILFILWQLQMGWNRMTESQRVWLGCLCCRMKGTYTHALASAFFVLLDARW